MCIDISCGQDEVGPLLQHHERGPLRVPPVPLRGVSGTGTG